MKKISTTNFLISIILTIIIPIFFSCYKITQRINDGTLQIGLPFVYYNITAIVYGNTNIKYAVHFQVGNFIADIVLTYILIYGVIKIVELIKSNRGKNIR